MVLWMTLAGLTWVGLITLLVYLLSGGLARRGPGVEPRETPLQIAQRRYASGELSEQDYERLKNTLR
jgi:uncharacterized membrane protein